MIYLLGGSGYVGQAYQSMFQRKGVEYRSLERSKVDYTDKYTLLSALKRDRPAFLINAAGYTGKPNVDACEKEKVECLFANAVFPGRLAEVCTIAKIPWGHVSSGCIYSGRRNDGLGFTETDSPNFTFRQNNCSFYSGTKALGEEILDGVPNIYIWRLRIPFDHRENPRNYLTKIMRYDKLLDAQNSISELNEFVESTYACWERSVPFGVYNVTNPGEVTTRQVVKQILKSGLGKKTYKFFKSESEFMSEAAISPRSNCILSSEKILSVGIKLTDASEAIQRALNNWQWV